MATLNLERATPDSVSAIFWERVRSHDPAECYEAVAHPFMPVEEVERFVGGMLCAEWGDGCNAYGECRVAANAAHHPGLNANSLDIVSGCENQDTWSVENLAALIAHPNQTSSNLEHLAQRHMGIISSDGEWRVDESARDRAHPLYAVVDAFINPVTPDPILRTVQKLGYPRGTENAKRELRIRDRHPDWRPRLLDESESAATIRSGFAPVLTLASATSTPSDLLARIVALASVEERDWPWYQDNDDRHRFRVHLAYLLINNPATPNEVVRQALAGLDGSNAPRGLQQALMERASPGFACGARCGRCPAAASHKGAHRSP